MLIIRQSSVQLITLLQNRSSSFSIWEYYKQVTKQVCTRLRHLRTFLSLKSVSVYAS